MSVDSTKDFIDCVKKSGVIDADRLSEWLEVASGGEPKDLAKQLVRDHLLTKWQAKYLMSGRSRLDIGSYRLLERTSRDELGDRFLAVHTSLARKVDLQVLPSQVTKEKKRIKAFLKKASEVGKLDHPNLIHVYDIDQEGGRFYLVTEFVEGKTLDQIARTRISETEVAKILSQSITGLTHAHENGVIHGSLTQNDLILIGDDIKIQNLAVSPLRENPTSEVADDIEAIKNIGTTLLGEIPESKRTEKHAELLKLLSELETGSTDSISSFGDSLAVWIGAPAEETESEFAFADPFAGSGESTGGFDQPIASALPTRKKKKPPKEEAEPELVEARPAGILGRLWKDNPIAVIATAGVLALLLVGGSAYGAFSLFAGSDKPVAKKPEFKSDVTRKNALVVNQDPVDFSDEEKMKRLIDAQFNKGNDSAKSKSPNQKSKAKTGNPKTKNKTGNDKGTPNVPAIPDVTTYKFPRLKSAYSIGPDDKKITIPAETAIKTISPQSSEGWIEIEAVLADNSKVTGWIESKVIYDGPATTQTAAVTPGVGKPPKTNPAKNDPKTAPGNAVAKVDPKPAVPAAELADDLTAISGIAEKTQTVLQNGEVKTYKKLASMSGEEVREALRKGGKTVRLNTVEECENWIGQAKKLAGDTTPIKKTQPTSTNAAAGPPKANPAGNPNVGTPFEKFPRVTQLPPVEDTTEKRIAPLVINQSYLLGAEIISDPAICKTKVIFELNRTVDDKQKWVVGVKRRPKEKPTELAIFRKSPDAFFFQWLPEAENNKYSEFLRNCFIKLKTPDDESTYLTLRTPIKIPDLRLTAGSLMNSLEIDIPAMPNPENIVIEVLPTRVQGLELDTVVSVIERGSPGRIMLIRRDTKGFMWIQVAGELKSKLKLQTNVLARVQNKIVPIANMNEVGNFVGTLRQAENVAKITNQNKQRQVAKKGQKTALDKEKAQFQTFANQATAATNKAIQYQAILAKTVNQPISVRVYVKYGTLRTQLVVTDSTLPQPPKKKKK